MVFAVGDIVGFAQNCLLDLPALTCSAKTHTKNPVSTEVPCPL